MKNESLETYQEKKKLEKGLKNLKEEVWSEKESVWEMNRHGQIEEIRNGSHEEVYIDSSVMLDR